MICDATSPGLQLFSEKTRKHFLGEDLIHHIGLRAPPRDDRGPRRPVFSGPGAALPHRVIRGAASGCPVSPRRQPHDWRANRRTHPWPRPRVGPRHVTTTGDRSFPRKSSTGPGRRRSDPPPRAWRDPIRLVVHLSVVLDAQVVAVCIGNFGSTTDCPWFPAEVVPDEPGKPLASQDLVPRSLDVEAAPPPRGVIPAQSGGQLGVGAAHDLSCILHL